MKRIGPIVALLALLLTQCMAAPWDGPATEVARKVAAVTGPASVALELHGAAFPSSEFRPVRNAVEAQLRATGLTVRAHDAAFTLRLTINQNARGWLWVGEVINHATPSVEPQLVLVDVPLEAQPASSDVQLPALRSTPLISSAEPLLDLQAAGPQTLVALTPHALLTYRQQGAQWQLAQTQSITSILPMPRDPRGRLAVDAAQISAFLPGLHCTTPLAGGTLTCEPSDDPWPIGTQHAFFNSSANFFTGVLTPGVGHPLTSFYSLADLPNSSAILALTDGRTVLADPTGVHALIGAAHNWGSDVAMAGSCSGTPELVAALSGADSGEDTLQAFHVRGREAVASSRPLKFEGAVTALWPSAAGATVVVQRPTGGYDAFSISLACR